MHIVTCISYVYEDVYIYIHTHRGIIHFRCVYICTSTHMYVFTCAHVHIVNYLQYNPESP